MCVLHPEDVIVTAKREKSFSHWCKKKKKKKCFKSLLVWSVLVRIPLFKVAAAIFNHMYMASG